MAEAPRQERALFLIVPRFFVLCGAKDLGLNPLALYISSAGTILHSSSNLFGVLLCACMYVWVTEYMYSCMHTCVNVHVECRG